MIEIINGFKEFDILTEKQREFLSKDREQISAENFDYLNLQRRKGEDDTFPNSFTLSWLPKIKAKVILSEKQDFAQNISFSGLGECEISNLKSNTDYFLKVIGERGESSAVYSFKTKYAPIRFVKIDGLTNVRDIGGRLIGNDCLIKQGLIYRGAEMNSHITVTESGLETMRQILQIKSVLDLRRDTEIVEDVYKGNYKNIPCYAYADIFEYPQAIRDIFLFFADKENYPIYFHCWGGADRTGTVAFLIGALLGEKVQSLLDDYEITSLSVWGVRSRNLPSFQKFFTMLNTFAGETLAEKTEKYLCSIGITPKEIQNIKEIMIKKSEK